MCEDWEAPRGILELQEALLNFMAVQGALWPMDPTPQVLLRVLLTYQYGAGHGDEEKRVRQVLNIKQIERNNTGADTQVLINLFDNNQQATSYQR
jgi:hypothetical protein